MKRGAVAVHTASPPKSPRTLLNTRALQLSLLLLYASALSNASPVSVPEKVNKPGKNIGGTPSSASLLIKPSAQDAQLNSLNAYATNYGHMAAQLSNNAAQTASSASSATNANSFKPSYKLPVLENNFTPIQTHGGVNIMPHAAPLTALAPNANSIASSNMQQATPVLMQYLSQGVPDAGVHYLQLIPTRPLIVPISPYLSGNAQAAAQTAAHTLHPPLAAAINGGPLDYSVRSQAILTPEPVNAGPLQQQPHPTPMATLIDLSNVAQPYGLQTYANAIQPYQPYRSSYRINREVKGKNLPGTMMLNMNEYIPGPNEALRPLYMRGRP